MRDFYGVMVRALALALLIASVVQPPARAQAPALTVPDAQLTPITWAELDGWAADDHAAGLDAFLVSCRAIASRTKAVREARTLDKPLKNICREALALGPATAREARAFFESRFRPVHIASTGETDGFLTGYYEPIVEGSRVPTGEFKTPLYRRPDDLVSAVSGAQGSAFPNKGGALRRVSPNNYVPYYDRAEIEQGALDGKGLEICWVKDPIDAFFIHIQGSARVRLEDGAMLRLNYAAHNGHPYTAVGAHLVQRGIVAKEEMSMDRIRQWMQANPDEGKELRRQNRSFIFFRIAELADNEEAIGAQGIPLTAGRSIAIDRKLHAYGTPFWIDAELPLSGESSRDRFRRLMIAQDTGSAIIGPARADIYFGAGAEQGRVSGRIRHPGRFVMLVPAALFPPPQSATAVPTPRPRPRS